MLHRIAWNYISALKSGRLDRDELETLQRKKIRALMRHAYENVPLYHDWFRERNLRPSDVQDREQLRLLPALTRESIESMRDGRMLAKGTRLDRTVTRRTTGTTTGKPLSVVWDSGLCDAVLALKLRNAWFIGLNLTAKTLDIQYWGQANSPGSSRPGGGYLSRLLIGPIDTQKVPAVRARVTGFRKSVDELKDELAAFRPDAVKSRPSYLRRLGMHLREEGRPIEIKRILPNGEYLSRPARQDIAERFGAEIFDYYGTQELGPLAIECRAHIGKHLFSDYFVFEFLKDGEPAGPGERAEVLVTPLHSRAMPLLRYRTGDIAVLDSDEKCECGSGLPRIREVLGRPDDGLVLPDGTRLPTGEVVDHLESDIGLREYQLIQTGMDSALLKLKAEQDLPRSRALVLAYLETILGDDVKMNVETWREDDIPPKYRPVMSRLTGDG